MTASVTILDRATIRETRAKVFRRGESTMIAEAAQYSVADLEATLTSLRTGLRSQLESLPDSAFEQQDGERWSAGQVTAHLVHAQLNIFMPVARRAASLTSGPRYDHPADDAPFPGLTREEALITLTLGDADLRDIFASLSPDLDLHATTEDDRLGTASFPAMLLFLTIHDDDHLGQLEELA